MGKVVKEAEIKIMQPFTVAVDNEIFTTVTKGKITIHDDDTAYVLIKAVKRE